MRCFILCFSLCFFEEAAFAECSDWILHVQDTSEVEAKVSPTKVMTVLGFCQAGRPYFPELTTVHYMEERDGLLCYRDMACGNLRTWNAYVAISGSWVWFDSMGEITGYDWRGYQPGAEVVASAERWSAHHSYDGGALSLYLAMSWAQVKRHCSAISELICLD